MELLHNIGLGFSVALEPKYLLLALLGGFLGTIVGMLPGLSKATAVALLLPLTFQTDDVVGAFILLGGLFYGAAYGGSTAAILVNTPGESESVIAAMEGHQMVKRGRAGAALATAAIGSFVAGAVGTIAMMVIAEPMVQLALKFGPVEYLAIMLMAFALVVTLGGRPAKAALSVGIGMMLGTVGMDTQTGSARFTFGSTELYDGIDFLIVGLGLFAISEVIFAMTSIRRSETIPPAVIGNLRMTRDETKRSAPAWGRGTMVGFIVGVLPGAGSTIASFTSYGIEKIFARPAVPFGKGAIEGLAGPEAANNSAASGALVPMLFLGIPGSAATAMMLAGLQGHGLPTGPLLLDERPDLVWGLIAALFIANAMLLVINLPMIRLWLKIVDIPPAVLYPSIVAISVIGVYSLGGGIFDVYLLLFFGVLGFLLRIYGVPLAPLLLALILAPMVETQFRRAVTGSRGDWAVLVGSPLANGIYALTVVLVVASLMLTRRERSRSRDAEQQSAATVDQPAASQDETPADTHGKGNM